MKTLYIVRHAKAEAGEQLQDIDRPLSGRGYRDAHQMAKQLAERKERPSLFISSSAVRTATTALIFARNVQYPASEIQFREELYHAEPRAYIRSLASVSSSVQSVLVSGHNPGITELANILAGRFTDNLVTCSVVRIDFDTDSWDKLTGGKLIYHQYPKESKLTLS